MYYTDENIKNLKRIYDQNSRKQYVRLDLNENPGGLDENFIEQTLKEITPRLISEYPETLEFSQSLADYLKVDLENICLVNGSSEGIRYIIEIFTSVGGKILGVVPTYAMFEVYSKMYGREFVTVSYTDELEMPIENILSAMTPDIQLLVLVNPNNPMGNAYSEKDIKKIIKKAKENEITILIDEAYHYFYPNTFLKYALNEENIFVTRTFSKLFSLAGLRRGYVVGKKDGIKLVQKLCTPHNVNAVAMLFAQRIIEKPEIIDELIEKHKFGRAYLISELEKNSYQYKGENGNFIFIRPKTDADEIVDIMRKKYGILIKSYDGIGRFGKCLRVTTAEKKYMEKFVTALLEIEKSIN